jgi:pilus assembly protein CpaB
MTMNGKALIPLVAGLTIGGFALWMGVNALKSARGAQKPVDNVKVWAAKSAIPHGTKITEDMVKPMAFPPQLIPAGAFQKQEDLVGRVPRIDAPAGLPVLDNMLLPPGASDGLHVPTGYRAVAVKIDEGSGVDYHLEPGCFVDVVGSFSTRRDGRQETLARTVVENVQIGAVGQRVSRVQDEEDGKSSSRSVRAVTLFVKPDDVPKLLLAEQKGRIKLSLRNDQDSSGLASNETVRESELLNQQSAEPKKAEPEPSFFDRLTSMWAKAQSAQDQMPTPVMEPVDESWEVVVCRGEHRNSVRFKNTDSSERIVEEDKNNSRSGPRPSQPPRIPPSRPRPTPPPPSSSDADNGDGADSESQGA